MRRLMVSICVLASTTACSHAPQAPRPHSTAALVVDQSAVRPGTQVRVGIQFVTDNDWHIYWKNPGDSGEPPQIRWQSTAGVSPGSLQWPSPTRMKTGAGTDYGYAGNVVLLSTLNIPPSVQPGTDLPVAGELRWLVCHDTCIPQRAELRTNVRVSNAVTVDNHAESLIAAAAERIPKPLPEALHLTASSSHDAFRLSFAPSGKVASVEFFPSEEEQIENAAPQVFTSTAGINHLELKKSDHLQRDPERLQGVLVFNGRDSYQVDVPIRSSTAHKEKR